MKTVIKILAVVLVLVIIAGFIAFAYINSIARKAVEIGATKALGVNTTLKSADVHPFAGKFAMSGLDVANPEGYSSPHFLAMDSGKVDLSLKSLTSDTIELPTLTLDGLDMNLQKVKGKANYDVIIANLKKLESDKPTEPSSPGKKYVIRTLLITNVKAHVDTAEFAGDLSKVDVPIDKIELHDVGSGGKPLSMSDLTGVVLKAVFAALIENGAKLPIAMIGELKNGLGSLASLDQVAKITGVGAGAVKDIANIAGDVTKDAGKALGDVGGKVGETAGDISKKAGDAIGGLLGGNKDEKKKDDEKKDQP
ncbi:MAG TPA: AsmA family protein [Phycisphaerales bacterium]|nr:AsmA family protein [Phycisphaerales bacterium]